MAEPPSTGGLGTPFAPRALVPVRVGSLSIMLYPIVDPSMPPHERAHAFHYNKTALAVQTLDLRLQLDALGTQLNLLASVDGIINDWFRFFYDDWFDFRKLTILSFHNVKGEIMTDTTDAGDPSVLLPVANGALRDCRKQNVKFVRVQLTTDFASLINVIHPGASVFRTEYYIELPQTSVQVLDGHGTAYTLLTFHGPADLRTMTPTQVQAQILDITFQDSPVDLIPSKFNLSSARTESSEMRSEIEGKILRLASTTIWNTMFLELCPGYSMQPHAAIDHIRQVHTDRDGNQVVTGVQEYYNQLMGAARPFANQRSFPVSLCARFQEGLDVRLQTGYRRYFPQHSVIQPLDAVHQRKTLQTMLQAAVQAEQDLKDVQRVAREAMGLSQAFHAGAVSGSISPTAGAYPSQAEKTMRGYSSEGGQASASLSGSRSHQGNQRTWTCFGCGGPHPWSEFRGDQGHVVICPNRDNSGIREHAAKQIEKMRKNRKKRHSQNLKRKNLGTANLSDFDEEGQKRIREQVLLAEESGSVTSSISTPSSTTRQGLDRGRGRGRGGGVILVADVVVLAAGSPLKRAMPISIQSNLPHITLQFGADLDCPNCPSIRCAVDSCAALTTGNFHFFAQVAKRYPHCVSKIFAPEDYAPIVLSGIVSSDTASVTTELAVGFLFHLPYRTREGDSASLMVATGPHVSVNTIIGLPFMRATGMIMDLVDGVVECKHLDCPPFPMEFRKTSNHVPVMDDGGAPIHHTSSVNKLINEIVNLERYYDAKVKAGSSTSTENNPSVHFGTRLPTRVVGIDSTTFEAADYSDTSLFSRWVPPSGVPEDYDDYPSSALGKDGLSQPPTSAVGFGADAPPEQNETPIRVAPKPKRRKRLQNVFLDDRGFPDQSEDYDTLLHGVDGGPILRKLKHPQPDLDAPIDPLYFSPFIAEKHEAQMRKDMDLSHLSPTLQEKLYQIIRDYWSVFDEKGVFIPVKNYECIIDTGSARPIAVKNILYGELETQYMRKCIAALAKVGHIRQITDGSWLFKALLAPKPHQEHVKNIDDFVWRFCVNYIPLNGVTRVIAYPIPRCDTAVFIEFSMGRFIWMFDAPMGYHQLAVASASQEKLAFQGVDAIKWTYTVMPFGPTNGPATFVNFIYDIDSVWKLVAASRGVPVGDTTNTRIIIDDIVSWSSDEDYALEYIRCQLKVCQAYRLSLNLRKSHFFPRRFEFVGIDVSPDGNRPAKSKHELLTTWPSPELVRDVAKFIGFAQFYSRFIHHFEFRISPLREICKNDYTDPVAQYWSDDAQNAFDEMRTAIISDPCLQRFDYRKPVILRTDFSARGFGYVLLQPGNDVASLKASQDYREGKGFTFMTKDSTAVLHPVCFGARKCRGNEVRLHSHLGECFAGDYGINKVRHYVFGQRFIWVTDCYAVKFILSYDGGNPAILRLQMRLMCWDVDVIHRPDHQLVDADYWSRLGTDIEFDPLFRDYLLYVRDIRKSHPSPTDLPMRPENMPYYRGPRVHRVTKDDVTADAHHIQGLLTEIVMSTGTASTKLFNVPVRFGHSTSVASPPTASSRTLLNSEIASYAFQAMHFSWAVYSFSNGHFSSTIQSQNLPFLISLACDTSESGRSLFSEFAPTAQVYGSGNALLHHIRSSGDTSMIHGYLINSYRFLTSETTTAFWKLQLAIIAQLRLIRSLSVIVAIVIPDHDGRSVRAFIRGLQHAHWKVTSRDTSYVDAGDSVVDSCTIITAIHSSSASAVEPLTLKTPPLVQAKPLASYLWEPFNKPDHMISFGPDDGEFNKDESNRMIVSAEKPAGLDNIRQIIVKYNLHRCCDDSTILAGSHVLSTSSLCPPFEACPNRNLFQHFFGIEFIFDGRTYVRAISSFEFTRCFNLIDSIQYRISHEQHRFALDASMPARTSAWLFDQVHDHLVFLRDSNCEVFSPNQFAAPAATIQTLVNGAICTRLPSRERWISAYDNDAELCIVRELALNPSQITAKRLSEVNHNYRGPLRQSQILIEDGMLILQEPICGSTSYTRLQLVPRELHNILFIAFHTNAIGGHLNAYRTMHRLRLRFYWPGMYGYVTRMCKACPGCALSNPCRGKSSELVYNFPIEAPFLVIHFDAYVAGKHAGFEGSDSYLIGACGMCSFACMEPVTNPSATTFASAIMRILLRYGFCHTAVLDKDSKFYGVCREALDLLQIHCHVLSGSNHNPMLVERINRYLNKGLRIMCNERDSVRVALEAILLLLYAWNSCPVSGTDISRSLVAVGREFSFPVDFSSGKHWELTSSASTVVSYSKELATRLSACREVAELLVEEQRAYHREYINARRPDPRIYSVGDIVFARRAVRSNAARAIVDKLQFAYTGPWKITAQLKGASYELEHCQKPGRKEKKHASDLSPYPLELIPFQPVDGADTRYGQLYKPISAHPFKEAGLNGFSPSQPYQVSTNLAITDRCTTFCWPSLSELNNEVAPFRWESDDERRRYMEESTTTLAPAFPIGPPPAAPATVIPDIPSVQLLVAAIIRSTDRLFFVSCKLSDNNAREWRLARVAFMDSMALYPSCTLDGRFLFEFYICHPADWRHNAVNQRYWLQLHSVDDLRSPRLTSDTHLVRPSDSSEGYTNRHKLMPFRKWLHICHLDTYIHGPFDFASIRGRKSRDRIAQADWDALSRHKSMFSNPIPSFDVATYSVHCDRGAHVSIHLAAASKSLIYEQLHMSDTEDIYALLGQKVSETA